MGFQTVQFATCLFVLLTEMIYSAYSALVYKQWGLLLLKKKKDDFGISFEVKQLHWHKAADSNMPQKNLCLHPFLQILFPAFRIAQDITEIVELNLD